MTNRNNFLSEEQRCDISYVLQHAKTQALLPFIEDILGILMREGFSLQQIIESLTQYVDSRPQFQSAVNYLELAAEAVGRVEREANLTKESDEII